MAIFSSWRLRWIVVMLLVKAHLSWSIMNRGIGGGHYNGEPNRVYVRLSYQPQQASIPAHLYTIYSDDRPFSRRQYSRRLVPSPMHWSRSAPAMPTFDNMPGQDVPSSMPRFQYNNAQAELIYNTLRSPHFYPMSEPVPGQVLYPPSVPLFRPKPIVQSIRFPGQRQARNLTMIPFYAHEAIATAFHNPRKEPTLNQMFGTERPHFLNSSLTTPTTTTSTTTTTTTTTSTTPSPPSTTTTTTTTPPSTTVRIPTIKPTKKRRPKKFKKYAAYRSPLDVHWQPPTLPPVRRKVATTTPFPMAIESPLRNHRFNNENDFEIRHTTPTPFKFEEPPKNFELTYKDNEDQFHIIYMDETSEKPTPRTPPPLMRPQARAMPVPFPPNYMDVEDRMYRYPVFTLSKLLQQPNHHLEDQQDSIDQDEEYDDGDEEMQADETKDNSSDKTNSSEDLDTWFIMNSRYKGPLASTGGPKRLSSKYIQHSVNRPRPNTNFRMGSFL